AAAKKGRINQVSSSYRLSPTSSIAPQASFPTHREHRSLPRIRSRCARLSLQIERHLIDASCEYEGKRVIEVDGRSDVLPDVEALNDRNLRRYGSRYTTLRHARAVDAHRDCRGLADVSGRAVERDLDGDLNLARRHRCRRRDRGAFD